jgi:hypothetical protein
VRRPCPAGAGCTVRERAKKGNKWSEMSLATWENKKRKLTAEQREEQKRRKEELKLIEREQKARFLVCPYCGKEFKAYDPRQIYCCKSCKNMAQNKKKLQRDREAR